MDILSSLREIPAPKSSRLVRGDASQLSCECSKRVGFMILLYLGTVEKIGVFGNVSIVGSEISFLQTAFLFSGPTAKALKRIIY
jgi:hypothetical protein